MRIITVSTTLPNIMDIVSFLDVHEVYVFDLSSRSVILTTHVVGLDNIRKNRYIFVKGLNKHVPTLLKGLFLVTNLRSYFDIPKM